MHLPVIGITSRVQRSAPPAERALFAVEQAYVEAVAQCGGAPVLIPPHLEGEALRAAFERVDGLLLSGGEDIAPALLGEEDGGPLKSTDEARDRAELALARWALAGERPLLAICRGIQVLNVAVGGTLVQDIPTEVPNALPHRAVDRPRDAVAHAVTIAAGSRLAALVGEGELGVNSTHHQAVKAAGAGLVVTAHAPDGVIEGVESPDHPFCLGVQWHPEAMVGRDPRMRSLFAGLVEAARARMR